MALRPRIAAALVLVLAGLVLVGILLLQEESGRGGGARSTAGTSPASRPGDPELARSGEPPTSRRERPASGERRPTSAMNPFAEEEPVLAFGHVVIPAGLEVEGLEVDLLDPFGDQLASADTDSGGAFEIRYGRSLLAGWSLAVSWITVKSKSPEVAAADAERWAPGVLPHLAAHPHGTPPLECKLAIGASPTIRGRVIDATTGQGIEGATIYACSNLPPWRDQAPDQTDSGSDGEFELPLVEQPLRQMVVWCTAADYQASSIGPLEAEPGQVVRANFSLRSPAAFKGRVLDEVTGRPVPGAEITLESSDDALAGSRTWGVTDETGTFAVDNGDLPLEHAQIRVQAKAFAPASVSARDPGAVHEIRIGTPVVITGKLVDSADTPVAGAEVVVVDAEDWPRNDPRCTDFVKTDLEGGFRLTLENSRADSAVVYVDHEPLEPFLAPLRTLQSKGSSATTRDLRVKVGGTARPASAPAASKPAAGGR